MKIRSSVFGSGSEKKLFKTLETHWSKKFNVYPSLPFTSIIDIRDSGLNQKQKEFLYKTSVDYTLCTKVDRPILSIDFDGLGHGFSKKGEYVQIIPTKDPYRKLKFDLKLDITNKVGYPLFVISYDEKVPIGEDLHLTIVDGIIGENLAQRHAHYLINERLKENEHHISELAHDEEQEYFQDLVTDAEVEAELTWDPISIKAAEYQGLALRRGLYKGYSEEYLCDPELPEGDPFSDLNLLERRIEAFKKVQRVGSRITVNAAMGEISETVWVRNFEGWGVSPGIIAENIAKLIVFKRAVELGRK
jgi:hypothetical protein